MSIFRIRPWEETRQLGKQRFILKYALSLGSGILLGVSGSRYLSGRFHAAELLLQIPVYLTVAALVGWRVWVKRERQYAASQRTADVVAGRST
jgi:hypothetical protein